MAVTMEMNIAEYLLPGVSSEDQLLFVICLIVVATLDICTKHCVGRILKSKKKRRCGKDIDPVDTLTAISELRNLSSNKRRQRALLEKIAEDTTCTHEEWKCPHHKQAPRIAEKWLGQAKELEEIILMIVSKQPKREYPDKECKHANDNKCKYAENECKYATDGCPYVADEYTHDPEDANYWAIV
ncbi:hypothetical protein D0863_09707 [Hortaea werneckii]|uniref:Uncharacterized protein n=1 Tax=Hortaea werneckii TaxID=91943 RepID=A0A3M7DK02_HORWE|nr:hypothetical protein D0863_09707 [Hortaea werneckii]